MSSITLNILHVIDKHKWTTTDSETHILFYESVFRDKYNCRYTEWYIE